MREGCEVAMDMLAYENSTDFQYAILNFCQPFTSIILIQIVYVHVQTHVTIHLLQYLHLWEMTTSVIQAVKVQSSSSSMVMILSGMVKDVVHTALAAPGTILHGL